MQALVEKLGAYINWRLTGNNKRLIETNEDLWKRQQISEWERVKYTKCVRFYTLA